MFHKNFALTIISLLLLINFSFGEEHKGWYEFDNGLEASVKESKPVLIDFYTDWCHWCKVLDKKTFSDKSVLEYMDTNFIRIKVDAEETKDEQSYDGKTMSSSKLAKVFGVTGYPALAFLDKDQKLITIVPGFLPPEKFINVLKYIKEECYTKDVSFEEYMMTGCEKVGTK